MKYSVVSARTMPELTEACTRHMNTHDHWRPCGSLAVEHCENGDVIYHQPFMSSMRAMLDVEAGDD